MCGSKQHHSSFALQGFAVVRVSDKYIFAALISCSFRPRLTGCYGLGLDHSRRSCLLDEVGIEGHKQAQRGKATWFGIGADRVQRHGSRERAKVVFGGPVRAKCVNTFEHFEQTWRASCCGYNWQRPGLGIKPRLIWSGEWVAGKSEGTDQLRWMAIESRRAV